MRISRGEKIREFQNLAKIIIIIALLKEKRKFRILNFLKSPKIRNSRKFEHAKITRSTVVSYFLNCGDYPFVITPGLWLFTMLIEVPCIAILANRGRTDDGQRAMSGMTKAHLTFDRMSTN